MASETMQRILQVLQEQRDTGKRNKLAAGMDPESLAHWYGVDKGFTSEEIEAVMHAQKVKRLPAIYREYLETMGHNAADMFLGANWEYEYLLEGKQQLVDMLSERPQYPSLPDEMFVMLSFQTTGFFLFPTENDDDPPVFFYHEGDLTFTLIAKSVSDWFLNHALHPGGPLGRLSEMRGHTKSDMPF